MYYFRRCRSNPQLDPITITSIRHNKTPSIVPACLSRPLRGTGSRPPCIVVSGTTVGRRDTTESGKPRRPTTPSDRPPVCTRYTGNGFVYLGPLEIGGCREINNNVCCGMSRHHVGMDPPLTGQVKWVIVPPPPRPEI